MSTRHPTTKFAKLLMDLGRNPLERTRNEVFDALGLDKGDYFLTKLRDADRILSECGVAVKPGLQTSPPDGVFLLRRKNAVIASEAAVRDRLSRHESASQEFKSTYWCHLDRLKYQPGATREELKSDEVKHSALKSIAGFLTTGGGTLFIGVNDAGQVRGLRPDLGLLSEHKRNADQLINNIRTDIVHRFRDGRTVNDYVSIEPVDVEETQILQLEVASRRRLSFLAYSKHGYQLFRRQGNRTAVVEIYELEEFQAWRNEYTLSVES